MIERKSTTQWEHTFPVHGEWNEHHTISVTKDGIVIDHELIPWKDIDAARAAAQS